MDKQIIQKSIKRHNKTMSTSNLYPSPSFKHIGLLCVDNSCEDQCGKNIRIYLDIQIFVPQYWIFVFSHNFNIKLLIDQYDGCISLLKPTILLNICSRFIEENFQFQPLWLTFYI